MKGLFAHVRAQFCHQSLGSKVHINVQNIDDPILLEDFAMEYSYNNANINAALVKKTESSLSNDNHTHLMVYILSGKDNKQSR